MLYVVWYTEHLRDGKESGAKVCDSLQEAIDHINAPNWSRNWTFRLFELGKEVPLGTETIEEQQPPTVKTKFKVG